MNTSSCRTWIACALAMAVAARMSAGQHITVALTDARGLPWKDHYNETTISVNPFNPNHFIVATNYQPVGVGELGKRQVWYGISTNGLTASPPFRELGFLPVPPGSAPTG